ncbi:MAG: hypothetical protein IJN43_03595 [Ruminococcus sp.]|nr:hypothetical protein [Ruminococcus sp.]
MKKDDLYDAISGIDEKFLSDSENFSNISNEFRKANSRKIGIISSLSAFSLILAMTLFLNSKGFLNNEIEKTSTIIENSDSVNSEVISTVEHSTDSIELDTNIKPTDNKTEVSKENNDTKTTGYRTEEVTNKRPTNNSTEIIEDENQDNNDAISENNPPDNNETIPDADNKPDDSDFDSLKEDFCGIDLENWLNNPDVIWGDTEIKGSDSSEKIALGSILISDDLNKLMKSGNLNDVYAVMVDFSSCIDENELLNWEYNGNTISELQSEYSKLSSFTDETYTYIGSDGIEHTEYLSSNDKKEEIKKIKQAINEIKAVYYDMKIQQFSDSFHKNGLEIYKGGEEVNTIFYTFTNKNLLKEFVCKENEAFIFYPASYFK